jgi:hypothetical protein
LLLRNVKGKYRDVSATSGPAFQTAMAARGAAFGDLDNDGRIDIVLNCSNRPAVVLRNAMEGGGNWVMLRLVGAKSNRDGIGTRIRLVADSGPEQHLFVSAAGSYLSSNDVRPRFGVGSAARARLVEVVWPSGVVDRLENVKANEIVTLREGGSSR